MTSPDPAGQLLKYADDLTGGASAMRAGADALTRLPVVLAQLDAAQVQVATLTINLAARDATVADLTQRLAACRAGQPPDPGSTPDPAPPPAPPPAGIRYGINAQGTGYAAVANRLARDGKIGVQRFFYPGMLPAKWDPTSPEKEAHVSFKVSPKDFAAGKYDAGFLAWAATIPADWWVMVSLYHEANNELRNGLFTETDFKAAYTRMRTLLDSQLGLGTVLTAACFMAYLVDQSGWADSWVPPDADLLVWDIYGNPQGGAGVTGKGLDQTPFRPPSYYADPCYRVTKRLGFTGRWGVTEHNAPARTWDPSESARVQWFRDFHAEIAADPFGIGQPTCVLMWEDDTSVNWGSAQQLKTDATRTWWRSVINP